MKGQPTGSSQARAVSGSRLRGGRSWLVFAILLVAYALITAFLPFPEGMTMVTGDEPHYLLSAHSLYYDGDMDLVNNYQNGDYHAFYGDATLDAHLLTYKGRLVPLRPLLGMPLLVLPAYVAGGRLGVALLLNVLMALGMASLHRILERYASSQVAFGVALFLGLTYPLVMYSYQVFPDTVAFVATSDILAWLLATEGAGARRTALVVGLILGLLLHLHYRFVSLVVILLLCLLYKHRARWLSVFVWSGVPILVCAIALAVWMGSVYGELSPDIVRQTTMGGMRGGMSGVVGLFFDQECGLFFYAPLYLVAPVGAWRMWRDRTTRADAFLLSVIYLSQHLLVGMYWDWIGGLSPVPRYLIPALPVLAVFAARGIEEHMSRKQWLQPTVLGLGSVLVTGVVLYDRRLMYGFGVGSNAILRQSQRITGPAGALLIRLLPSFWTAKGFMPYVKLVAVLVGLVLFWLSCNRLREPLCTWVERLSRRRTRYVRGM